MHCVSGGGGFSLIPVHELQKLYRNYHFKVGKIHSLCKGNVKIEIPPVTLCFKNILGVFLLFLPIKETHSVSVTDPTSLFTCCVFLQGAILKETHLLSLEDCVQSLLKHFLPQGHMCQASVPGFDIHVKEI